MTHLLPHGSTGILVRRRVEKLEPVIRNFRNIYVPEGPAARLMGLEDNSPTCTMSYSEIYPDKTSSHHQHPWEHEIFIIRGSGVLVCDGVEYPVREGDAIYIPGGVDHYTLNNGGQGVMRRIEVNPLVAAQAGGGRTPGGAPGSGQPPTASPGLSAVATSNLAAGGPVIIRNLAEIDQTDGPARQVLGTADGAANYIMAFRSLDPGSTAPNHAHEGEHLAYILEGTCILDCDGVEHFVAEGDAALVPPHTAHEWRSNSEYVAKWLVFNPVSPGG